MAIMWRLCGDYVAIASLKPCNVVHCDSYTSVSVNTTWFGSLPRHWLLRSGDIFICTNEVWMALHFIAAEYYSFTCISWSRENWSARRWWLSEKLRCKTTLTLAQSPAHVMNRNENRISTENVGSIETVARIAARCLAWLIRIAKY